VSYMKTGIHSESWLTIIERVTSDPALYELVEHCPLNIMRRWSLQTINRGSLVFRQGEVCQQFQLILQGDVDVYFEANDGRKYLQARYHRGDMLGELEVFEQRPYICSVEAVTETLLLTVSRDDFNRWLAIDNHFSQRVLRTFSQQYYQLSKKAGTDSLYSLQQRVAQALWQQFSHQGKTSILLDKQQLSHEFAVAIRSINRILFELKEQQIIGSDGERITLKDAAALQREAGQ